MYELVIPINFDAAHVLPNHEGQCRNLHGHTYKMEVHIQGSELKDGMVVDFDLVKKELEKVILHLDHKLLNESLNTQTPTAEFISMWAFNYLFPRIGGLKSVSVQEGKHGKAIFSK